MRLLCLLFCVCPLFGQGEGSRIIAFEEDTVDRVTATSLGDRYLISDVHYVFQITRASNGDKTFNFIAYKCIHTLQFNIGDAHFYLPLLGQICTPLSKSDAEQLGPIDAGLDLFNSLAPGEVAHTVVYGPFAKDANPRTASAQTAGPQDPTMILLDGLGSNIFKFDLANYSIVSQAVVPSTVGPLGVRPTAAGDSNEVWVANGGTSVAVVDFTAGKVVATIPGTSTPLLNSPAGIVFTNSGNTALEAVTYLTPDSSGNQGALLVFDAVNRKLTSTLPLKYAPQSILMAPDGLTAYLLGSGKITYYDVFSGTADLTAPFTFFSGPAFIHPDGTRIFISAGTQLQVFDMTSRKFTQQFSSGLPSTSAASMQISQDGSIAFFGNGDGAVVYLDTRYGNVMTAYQASGPSLVFGSSVN
jgi:hypothetical protein